MNEPDDVEGRVLRDLADRLAADHEWQALHHLVRMSPDELALLVRRELTA